MLYGCDMKIKIFVLALALLCLFSSCAFPKPEENQPALQKFSDYKFDYFDTVSKITGYAESREAFDLVAQSVFAELEEYHRLYTIYHRYEGLENLRTINDLKDGEHRTVTVDRRIIDLLLYAKEMYALTNGQMNIAMGSVLSIWHEYREEGLDDPENATLPPMEDLLAAAGHTDIQNLVIDEEALTVRLTDPKMKLDVGALAKGYAVEMLAESLEKQGITGYVLNIGGNVRTIGTKPDGTGWTVGIEDPLDPQNGDYIAYLSLAGQSLVTSGSYQRYYTVDGKRYHHIVNPETLMPAEGFVSVSVLTGHSGLGDALSTALFCMTLEEGQALVASLPEVEAQWVLPDGSRQTSNGWKTYTITL